MHEDKEGFLQPEIDAKICVGCHKCEKTCPVIKPITQSVDSRTKAYLAINRDDEARMRSSSGGVFYALAKWTIEQGGVVFGARFNKQWEVIHDYTDSVDGIEPFLRSKYVQSRVGDTFYQTKQFLQEGRQVLYTGTPCQIEGLKAYLDKDYENLTTIDIICHGVPSPKVWRAYIKQTFPKSPLLDFSFRDKKNGWINFQCAITTSKKQWCERQRENVYFKWFLKDIYLRQSCYVCPYKTIHRISDITIADAWGVQYYCPQMYDDKGTSLIILHTPAGQKLIEEVMGQIRLCEVTINSPAQYNPSLTKSPRLSYRRKMFFSVFSILGYKCAIFSLDMDAWVGRIKGKLQRKTGAKN